MCWVTQSVKSTDVEMFQTTSYNNVDWIRIYNQQNDFFHFASYLKTHLLQFWELFKTINNNDQII